MTIKLLNFFSELIFGSYYISHFMDLSLVVSLLNYHEQ